MLSLFRNWLSGGTDKNNGVKQDPVLGGRAEDMLDDERDFIALRTPACVGTLLRLLQNHWPFPK